MELLFPLTQLPTMKVVMPGARLSLRKNFTWTFAGNGVYAASQWGQLVLLAKLGSPETVGQFALALAICAPVIMFANLQLRSVQATDARHEYAFADYLGLRLMTTVAAYVVIIGIVMLSGYQQETALAILLIGLSKYFEAVSDVIFGLLQQQERMDRIAKSLMIGRPVNVGCDGSCAGSDAQHCVGDRQPRSCLGTAISVLRHPPAHC